MKKILFRVMALLTMIGLSACSEKEGIPNLEPEIMTVNPINVDYSSASVGCTVKFTGTGNKSISSVGVVCGQIDNPTIGDDNVLVKEKDITAKRDYVFDITDLEEGKDYFVRAFARNENGVIYGSKHNFKTKISKSAELETIAIKAITCNSATIGANITFAGSGSEVLVSAGVVYSEKANTSFDDESAIKLGKEKTDVGEMSFDIKTLEEGKTYYVRAYAKSGSNIVYGDEITFTTLSAALADVKTLEATASGLYTATIKGELLSLGTGSKIVNKVGIVYGEKTAPVCTVDGNKMLSKDVDAAEAFSFDVVELKENTKYFVRSFAFNGEVYVYGNELSFTTSAADVAEVKTLEATANGLFSAAVSANLLSVGTGSKIINKVGVVYGKEAVPVCAADGTKMLSKDLSSAEAFSFDLIELEENTKYFVRAFAFDGESYIYANEISFTTLAATSPELTTVVASEISFNSAKVGVTLVNKGSHYKELVKIGVMYGENESLDDDMLVKKDVDILDLNTYAFTLSDLTKGTKYYYKAYGKNAKGEITSFGEIKSFTVLDGDIPMTTLCAVSNIKPTSVSVSFTPASAGTLDAKMTSAGVLYCKKDCLLTIGGEGVFNIEKKQTEAVEFSTLIENLEEATGYKVVSYIRYANVYIYSEPTEFTTTSSVVPVLSATTASNISFTGVKLSSSVVSLGLGSGEFTQVGFVYGENEDPTVENCIKSVGIEHSHIGAFSCDLNDLAMGTRYNARAYARCNSGVVYGESVRFTTEFVDKASLLLKNISYGQESVILTSNVISMGSGDGKIESVGVVIGLSDMPTLDDSDAHSGEKVVTAEGDYTFNIKGLNKGGKYHARAYSKTAAGVFYGEVVDVDLSVSINGFVYSRRSNDGYSYSSLTFNLSISSMGTGSMRMKKVGVICGFNQTLKFGDANTFYAEVDSFNDGQLISDYEFEDFSNIHASSIPVEVKGLKEDVEYHYTAYYVTEAGDYYYCDLDSHEEMTRPLIETYNMWPKDFYMGHQDVFDNPKHTVTLTEGFKMGITEVTNAQYEEIMGVETPSDVKGNSYPVTNISWYDAQDFVKKLSEKTGRTYRLPTEAEWEYAAGKSPTANSPYKYGGAYFEVYLKDFAVYNTASVAVVKTKSPALVVTGYKDITAFYDMSGNVAEWCSDNYGTITNENCTDPKGASTASGKLVKGGSFVSDADACMVSARDKYAPSHKSNRIGLRVMRVMDADDK